MKWLRENGDFSKTQLPSKARKYELILHYSVLIILIVGVDFLFAMLYDFVPLSINLDDALIYRNLTKGDFIYFSIAIHYSLPLSESFSNYQNIIGKTPALMITQINHVVSSKIIDLTVIGFLASLISNKLLPNVKKV